MKALIAPYLGWIKIGLAIFIILAVAYSYCYTYNAGNTNGKNAVEVEYQAASLAAAKKAQLETQNLQAQLDKANHDAKDREAKLASAANSARTAANSLQHDLDTIRTNLPKLTEQAVRQYADTASVVFGECTDRYIKLAAKADAIDSDRQTLAQAWPNN